jgi:hypothetical protein
MNEPPRVRCMPGEEAWAVLSALTAVFLLSMPLLVDQAFLRPSPTGPVHSSIGRP